MENKKYLESLKEWVERNKTTIVIGTITMVAGAVSVFLINKKAMELDEENEKIVDAFREALEWDGETGDRYIIDTETMKKLPPGMYDVFDSYENERVDFVVE